MSAPPRISDAEWAVMRLLWEREPQTAQELAAALEPERGWSDRTVKTLLSRLVKKGALSFEAEGKRYLYRPAVEREDCLRAEGRSLLDRVSGGRASPVVAWFLEEAELSSGEIDELRRILDEKERER